MLCEDKVIAICCLIDDVLKTVGHKEDKRRKVTDSELITTALVLARYFGGHQDNARRFMKITNLVPSMLDKSYFDRRLHKVSELLFSFFIAFPIVLFSLAFPDADAS